MTNLYHNLRPQTSITLQTTNRAQHFSLHEKKHRHRERIRICGDTNDVRDLNLIQSE